LQGADRLLAQLDQIDFLISASVELLQKTFNFIVVDLDRFVEIGLRGLDGLLVLTFPG
jgi:hypothetical protein